MDGWKRGRPPIRVRFRVKFRGNQPKPDWGGARGNRYRISSRGAALAPSIHSPEPPPSPRICFFFFFFELCRLGVIQSTYLDRSGMLGLLREAEMDTAAAAVGDWAGTTVGEGIKLRFTYLRLGLSELLLSAAPALPRPFWPLDQAAAQGLMPGPSVEYQLEGRRGLRAGGGSK